MKKFFKQIPNSSNWEEIKLIKKGWSQDKKYYIKTKNNEEYLLRVSDINNYQRKKNEFETMELLKDLDINMTRPISFGTFDNNKNVYSLFTWLSGEDVEKVLPDFNEDKQYQLGIEAGKILKKMHSIPAPIVLSTWEERFNFKIDRNISSYQACSYKMDKDEKIINYINNNRHLLKERPQTFQHGDYHIGNMIYSEEGQLGIIDFNRFDYGDPWEEFNRITWCASISPNFASGYINGYFENKVPDSFFKLLALYIARNQIASLPWAIAFGSDEIHTMIKQTELVMSWYDDFNSYIPNWYKK